MNGACKYFKEILTRFHEKKYWPIMYCNQTPPKFCNFAQEMATQDKLRRR